MPTSLTSVSRMKGFVNQGKQGWGLTLNIYGDCHAKAFWHAMVQSKGAFFFSVRRCSGLSINAKLL